MVTGWENWRLHNLKCNELWGLGTHTWSLDLNERGWDEGKWYPLMEVDVKHFEQWKLDLAVFFFEGEGFDHVG